MYFGVRPSQMEVGYLCLEVQNSWPVGHPIPQFSLQKTLLRSRSSGAPAWSCAVVPISFVPIGAKVIEGFGKALRKAIGETKEDATAEASESEVFVSSGKTWEIEEFIWHLHQSGCPPVFWIRIFRYDDMTPPI